MQSPSVNWWLIGAALIIGAAVPVLEYTTVLPPWPSIPYWTISTTVAVILAYIGSRKSMTNSLYALGFAVIVAATGVGFGVGINRFIVDNISFWPPGAK